jgi:lambda family phage portal protein
MQTLPVLYDQYSRPIRSQKRNFDGAKGSRYTADWVASAGPADKFLKHDLKALRERARDLERNDGYAESLFIELESNIIGPKGIKLKPMARKADLRNKGGLANKLDSDACAKIEAAWEDFSKQGKFDVTRQNSRQQFERTAIRSVARDGGFLVRFIDGLAKSEYRFGVQGIEADALDPRMNDEARRISMGIEFDEWDEPIAYHLTKTNPKSSMWTNSETFRVAAEDAINLFMAKRINQSQGFSWLAPVMTRLRHLSKYEEAEVIAARVSSNKIGFFEQTGEQPYAGDEDGDGNIVAPSSPGEWETLPHGVKPHLIDPSHPNADYPDFRKAILRGVCAGIYVNYNTLAKDLEGVSYSSIRQGVLSERDIWRIIQAWFIDSFEVPVFNRWLKMALLSGKIDGLGIGDYERLCHAEFSGRTWSWVDPAKDIQAAREEIELGINSRQAICRDRGKDFAKIVVENEEDVAALEKAGLPTSTLPVAAPVVEKEEAA